MSSQVDNASQALDRLGQLINKSRATYVPGTPEKYPLAELRGLTILEAEALLAQAEQLREERDGWEKIAESRALYAHKQAARMGAHASAPQPTPVSGVPLAATGKASEGAEDGTGIDTRYRGRAEAAEAELQRLRGGISVRDALVTENAIRAAAAEAEAQRYREGLREAVGMIRFPCAECKPFIDKARALLADSPPGTCCCPSGSYNPGAVHEPYCPAGGGAK